MRAFLESILARVLPGLGWRPLYLSATATWLMVLYHHHGAPDDAPVWFIEGSQRLLGIELVELHQHLWAHASAVVLLMLVPLALCWFAEGWSPRELGFSVKKAGPELLIVLGLWLVMIPIVWVVSSQPAFSATYPRLRAAEHSFTMWALFEGFYVVKWIAWEFFFRGFMLFGFQRDFMSRAVLVSTIPFALMHYGKPELEMASAVIAGIVLCLIALRSRSIWPGVLLHWLVASTMDFMASDFWR
ncbi:MAG: CPBP family glutamic-type intramembrane protease [Sandaracinaceae bacterium]